MILSKLTNKDDTGSDIRPENANRDKQQEDFVSGIFVLEKLAGWLLFLPEVVGGGIRFSCLGDDWSGSLRAQGSPQSMAIRSLWTNVN